MKQHEKIIMKLFSEFKDKLFDIINDGNIQPLTKKIKREFKKLDTNFKVSDIKSVGDNSLLLYYPKTTEYIMFEITKNGFRYTYYTKYKDEENKKSTEDTETLEYTKIENISKIESTRKQFIKNAKKEPIINIESYKKFYNKNKEYFFFRQTIQDEKTLENNNFNPNVVIKAREKNLKKETTKYYRDLKDNIYRIEIVEDVFMGHKKETISKMLENDSVIVKQKDSNEIVYYSELWEPITMNEFRKNNNCKMM